MSKELYKKGRGARGDKAYLVSWLAGGRVAAAGCAQGGRVSECGRY